MKNQDSIQISKTRADISKRLISEPLGRVNSRGAHQETVSTSGWSRSSSDAGRSPSSLTTRWRLGRTMRSESGSSVSSADQLSWHDDAVMCGFVKRSTGIASFAWWSDTVARRPTTEPGRGWRPFKTFLQGDTLVFYKIPANMVPEVRRTFQIRSTQWPTAVITADDPLVSTDCETEASSTSDLLVPLPLSDPVTSRTADELEIDFKQDTALWTQSAKHPELQLVSHLTRTQHWASRIEGGTTAALAHELVFATQRVSADEDINDDDTKTFLHLVFYSLSTTNVPWHQFVHALRDNMMLVPSSGPGVQRIALFIDLLLWKRPLLHPGHEARFFEELHFLIVEIAQAEPSAYAPMQSQVQSWREQASQPDVCRPIDWLQDSGRGEGSRPDLVSLQSCWNAALFVKQDAGEIARQIQSFHVDRLKAFFRLPVTAYRLGSSVTEPLLRSFRFDAVKPHWLTHVILRQLLVDEAPERHGDECAAVPRHRILEQWIQVGINLLHYGDVAGWVAVCSALCSRAAATLDVLWRRLPTSQRKLITQQWAPELASLGWIEGVEATVQPVLALESTGSLANTPGGIPYLGNAGILHASATILQTKHRKRPWVPLASQESEFNRVRELAQQLSAQYNGGLPVPMAPAPIAEYQALFQRLSTYEFVLQISVMDYMGNAVLVDGHASLRPHLSSASSWATEAVEHGAMLFTFPTPFPTLTPGSASADAIVLQRDVTATTSANRAFASLPRCAARGVTRSEEVDLGQGVILYPMQARIVGVPADLGRSVHSGLLRSEASRPGDNGPVNTVAQPDPGVFPVEIRAATPERLLDTLVLGTDHLLVRVPVPPAQDTETFQLLRVGLNLALFRDAVLLSYRGWISANDLFEALVQRWQHAESASRELAWHARSGVPNQYPSWAPATGKAFAREPINWDRLATIRLRVLRVLHRWLELYPRDWISDLVLFDALYNFLQEAVTSSTAIASESLALVNAVNELLTMYPTLTTRSIANMGMDCVYGYPNDTDPARAFDWSSSPADLVAYLESMVAPAYAMLYAYDLAGTAQILEQMQDSAKSWLQAARRGDVTALSMYRLLRSLPPGHTTHAPSGSSLWDMLPASVREVCRAHEAIRDWVEAQVTEPRIGIDRRVERIARFLDTALMSRAMMAHAMQRASVQNSGTQTPLAASFVEAAIMDGLTSTNAQLYRAAWEQISVQRNVSSWTDVLAQMPSTMPPQLPTTCTPDLGWMLATFGHWAARPKARVVRHEVLLEFSRFMSQTDLALDALAMQASAVDEAAMHVARVRLSWIQAAVLRANWPRTVMLEDAALEGTFKSPSPSGPLRLFATLQRERDEKRGELESVLLDEDDTATVHQLLDVEEIEMPDMAALALQHADEPAQMSDSLFRAVPTGRPSTHFRCAGALISVWPYQRHPFVLQLAAPHGQKCTLKFPNYDEFCRWLSHFQALPNVRMSESFDAGTYAANVADFLGRTSASCVFGVPLKELNARGCVTPLPPALERVLEEIETRGLLEQGIYRISGTRNAVEQLKQMLDTKPLQQLNFSRLDVHVLSSVVKLWLRELPEPVVPFAFYDALIESEKIPQQDQRVRTMRKIMASFPQCHYNALKRIVHHLFMVSKASKANLMAAHNLGLVFGSTLLNPPPGSGSVSRGLENLGRAAHIVKIMVVMHRHIFTPLPS